ncbi:hypothetical protein EWM64_g3577 [Hericium alpestre]|uniref:Fungal ligninase C-terminal domain-containing protein n=1 Tax=Hericium alpestre TaxID=135208 RepID=A0A4Z0A426_9AGAM|nr:hypothetical protein EWM64_g3577 [Hericium alpestre]
MDDAGFTADETVALLAAHSIEAFDTQIYLDVLLEGIGYPGHNGSHYGEAESPLESQFRVASDAAIAHDPRTACTWQSLIDNQERMTHAFREAMHKLALNGQHAAALVDCSEVIPESALWNGRPYPASGADHASRALGIHHVLAVSIVLLDVQLPFHRTMLRPTLVSLLLLLSSISYSAAASFEAHRLRVHGAQSINQWKRRSVLQNAAHGPEKAASFPVYNFTQPLDHFFNTTNATFGQRYWVSTRHYKPGTGAPVIVIDGGETSGEDRLSYLDTGIADILAKATGGVGVVLEHRYYGESIGVANFTTDNLRWLTNEQALEDSANFMRNVTFAGIDEDLTAPNTPWIYFGGSYAGARAAHMKVLYPDIVYGAIASSGVTHAGLTNWEYMDVIRLAANKTCSDNLVQAVAEVDALLASPKTHNQTKALFGLEGLEHDVDFVSTLTSPLGAWQNKNWDPAIGDTSFDAFCDAINVNTTGKAGNKFVTAPNGLNASTALLNYADYIKSNVASECPTSEIEACFGTYDDSQYTAADLSQTWRLWTFQYCTVWGYLTTAPPSEKTPTIISRLLDLHYEHKICVQAFPPGKHFQVPRLPNIIDVNRLGNFAIAADRLAIVDGEIDPWRPDTPHSQYYAKPRPDTTIRPFKLIPGAVHHWDENGLANSSAEPPEIKAIHEQEIAFVQAWLKDFKKGPALKVM